MGWYALHTRYRTMSTNETIECEFTHEKTTKNTYRYAEVGEIPKIGSLYIQKFALGAEPPKSLKVVVEVR
jgi:hypothetical protein